MTIKINGWRTVKENIQKQVRSTHKMGAQRILESQLASIIVRANSLRDKQVPRGAPQFQSLWTIALAKVEKFCDGFGIPQADIEAQIPALMELKDWATPVSQTANLRRIILSISFAISAVIAAGFASETIATLFDTGEQVFHSLMRFL
jgi:hypothetical protein